MKKNFLLPAEIWADIEGFEGLYQASNEGQIRSLDRMVKHPKGGLQTVKGKILKPSTIHGGYYIVDLYKNGERKHFQVHRLVYETFCGKIPEGMQVNHINEDKSDNRLCNLNLMTRIQNVNWGTGIERRSKALSKPVVGFDVQGNVVVTFQSTADAGRNGYRHQLVSLCCRGKKPQYKGLIWKYADGDC